MDWFPAYYNGFNPFLQSTQSIAQTTPRVDISTTGNESSYEQARNFLYEAVNNILDSIGESTELAERNLADRKINCAKGDKSPIDALALIVSEYIDVNEGDVPDESLARDIVEVLNDPEESTAFMDLIPDWTKSTTSAMQMSEIFDDDSDSDTIA